MQIARLKIVSVLDATADLGRAVDVAPENYLCVPVLDGDAPTTQQLDAAGDFICKQVRDKKPTLVHCAYGIGVS